jgi:hypothetical protein
MRYAVLAVVASFAVLTPTAAAQPRAASPYGPSDNTAHAYVQHGQLDAFIHSWEATFGGTNPPPAANTITPTGSRMVGAIINSPIGVVSAYDYQTPVPYPFGAEHGGVAVHGVDAATATARVAGGVAAVAPWTGPGGREAVVQFPGGVDFQLYEPGAEVPKLAAPPEYRIYLSDDAVNAFLAPYLRFAGGHVASDNRREDGAEIGAPGTTYHRIRLASPFGDTVVLAGNGYWNYPYGKESTGYTVPNLTDAIAKATANGATVLSGPHAGDHRNSAMLEFPGGYLAEFHDKA